MQMPKPGYKLVQGFFNEIFEIPPEWKYPKFSDIVYVNPKTKISSKEVCYVPMEAVSIQNGSIDYFEERSVDENSSLPKFKENDILFARITPSTENGKVCIIESFSNEGIASSDLIVLRPTNQVVPRYLFYFVQTNRVRQFAISQMKGTTGRQRVPDNVFKKDLNFELPPLKEQARIVEIIFNVHSLIQKTDQVIEQTQRLKKGLMQRLLTKGIGHSRFNDSNIGIIPHTWEIAKLGNIATISTGNTPSTLVREYYVGDIPFIRTAEITNRVIRDAVVHISKKAVEECSLEVYPPKTVLLAMYGQGKTRGQSALLDTSAATSQNAAAIVVNESKLDSLFLWHYLLYSYDKLREMGNIGHISHLNLNFVKKLTVPVPVLEEQKKIALILSQISHKIEKEFSIKNKIEELKKGQMQNLLTGKIRVKL